METGQRGGIVTARGTGEGLIISLDGRVGPDSLKAALNEYIKERKNFLAGNEVTFEWVGQEPEASLIRELSEELSSGFNVNVRASRFKDPAPAGALSEQEELPSAADMGLFGGISAFDEIDRPKGVDRVQSPHVSDGQSNIWDDADMRSLFSTLRSGQKVETEHSLIVFGDVNSGAEIIAGGDIVVLGTLRGVAHAGAYDETGGGRVVVALNLQATQLRIGMVISRGPASDGSLKYSGSKPEIARVDGNSIVVEAYDPRLLIRQRS
jgi:septum site-determining protein MinC